MKAKKATTRIKFLEDRCDEIEAQLEEMRKEIEELKEGKQTDE